MENFLHNSFLDKPGIRIIRIRIKREPPAQGCPHSVLSSFFLQIWRKSHSLLKLVQPFGDWDWRKGWTNYFTFRVDKNLFWIWNTHFIWFPARCFRNFWTQTMCAHRVEFNIWRKWRVCLLLVWTLRKNPLYSFEPSLLAPKTGLSPKHWTKLFVARFCILNAPAWSLAGIHPHGELQLDWARSFFWTVNTIQSKEEMVWVELTHQGWMHIKSCGGTLSTRLELQWLQYWNWRQWPPHIHPLAQTEQTQISFSVVSCYANHVVSSSWTHKQCGNRDRLDPAS